MSFALIFVVTSVAVVALAGPIKRWPWIFYSLSILAVAVLFAGMEGALDGGWWKPLILLVKRCMVALSLFAIVMFTGALPKESKLGIRLRSVRSELSIIACILCLGHVLQYLAAYLSRAAAGSLDLLMGASIYVALVLFALLIVLGVTSGTTAKKRMKGATWKRIQWFAYPFFLLTYVHLMLMIAPAALRGGEQAITSALLYSIVFVAYTVMRLYRYAKDKSTGLSDVPGDEAGVLPAEQG